jgi:hypothetical protein
MILEHYEIRLRESGVERLVRYRLPRSVRIREASLFLLIVTVRPVSAELTVLTATGVRLFREEYLFFVLKHVNVLRDRTPVTPVPPLGAAAAVFTREEP